MEAMVDFVEDDIPPQLDSAAQDRLAAALTSIETMLIGAEGGIVLREGATLAIVGAPNVGKSSIMNALLGTERSIVTPIAGTTRDTVEEVLDVRGIPFRTVDTAGITETEDVVERIGVERSRKTLEAADVVLLVLDRSRPFSRGDSLAMEAVAAAGPDTQRPRVVVALNKSDLPAQLQVNGSLSGLRPLATVESTTVGAGGLEALRAALEGAALGGTRREFVVANVRHVDALRRSAAALRCAIEGLDSGTPLDLVSFDVRTATAALGEITGASVDDELLDRIFRDFCIGK
jgi:tRNA modification GTPase